MLTINRISDIQLLNIIGGAAGGAVLDRTTQQVFQTIHQPKERQPKPIGGGGGGVHKFHIHGPDWYEDRAERAAVKALRALGMSHKQAVEEYDSTETFD